MCGKYSDRFMSHFLLIAMGGGGGGIVELAPIGELFGGVSVVLWSERQGHR